ncbi:MAG: type II secretion system protein [Patescibacteria group bacterium]|jgi:prepilin-type N-terminal cleavage/methylation domain-containing protein
MSTKSHTGFTLVEIVIVMGIMVVLMMIGSVNFFPIKQKVSLTTTVSNMITDFKQQQLKAMSGKLSTGIYFDPDNKSYVVFEGDTYNPANNSNFRINLGDQIETSIIDFSGRQIIFNPLSGEINNYINGNKIALLNTFSKEQKLIYINKYGIITNVQ